MCDSNTLRQFSGYVLEWGYRYCIRKGWNGNDYHFAFRPGCFDKSIASGADITLTQDLDGVSVFARTGNGTLKLTSDDMGLLAHVTLLDTPLNRELCELIDDGRIRGWSHRAQPVFMGFRVRKENGIPFHDHHRAELTEITLVVRKIPRAKTRKTPIFLSMESEAKGLANVC